MQGGLRGLQEDDPSYATSGRRSEGGRAPLPAIGYSYRGAAYDARDDEEEEEEAVVVRPPPPVTEVNTTTSVDLFDASAQPQIISPMPSLASSSSANTSSTSLTQYQYDEFMPANQKTFDSISNEILGAYDNSAANGNNVPQPAPANAAPSASRALVPVSEEGIDPISKSMKDLVNLDDITTAPFQPIGYTSSGAQQQNKPAVQSWDLVGRAPTLSEMRTVTSANGAATVQKEVMKTHPTPQYYQGQQHQALVAYGAAPPPQQYGYYQGYNVGYAPAY